MSRFCTGPGHPARRPILAALAGLLLLATVAAAAGTGLDLSWWTVDGGGGTMAGDGYTLSGTVGQADAGQTLAGGGYTLTGGFWSGVREEAPRQLFLPLVVRGS